MGSSFLRRSFFPLLSSALAIGFAFAMHACGNPDGTPGEGRVKSVSAELNLAERMARYTIIRDTAAKRDIFKTGYLLGGIAYAETNLAHCWSEATWACKGPNSADCGGGPVIAGSADGPCASQLGGLGMFQFDAGNFNDTLNKYGPDVLTISGNVNHAIDYVINMVKISKYTTNAETDAKSLQWIANFDINNGTLRDQWISTVTHYYNGCLPSYSCWSQRYAHYNDSLQAVVDDTGLPFWVVSQCTPSAEVCDGKDNDCNNQVDEGEVCEQQTVWRGSSWIAPPNTTDVDGDGKADVCARGASGLRCFLSNGAGWKENTAFALSFPDSAGWGEPKFWSTLRMGDLNGDGKADVCARSSSGISCWLSEGTKWSAAITGPAYSDASGWGDVQYYSTIRLADIDGDQFDDLCARDSGGFNCLLSTGTGFGTKITGPDWSSAQGFGHPKYYGTLQMADIDGNGMADVCIRAVGGMDCRLSDGKGFPTKVSLPSFSDAGGWGAQQYWSTIRLVDVNGDKKSDICARSSANLFCHLSKGTSFGDAIQVAALSDASGWNTEDNYLTLRTGDVTGDGAQDLCIRSNSNMVCFAWNGKGFDQFDGPGWSDAANWNDPKYYETLRLGDMTGDGKFDLCARANGGFACLPSTGKGFGAQVNLGEMTDTGGWGDPKYYGTILMGGPSCSPKAEICNGKDDDCDGKIDNGVCGADAGPDATGFDSGIIDDGGPLPDAGQKDGSILNEGGVDGAVGIVNSGAPDEGCSCTLAPVQSNTSVFRYLSIVLAFSLAAISRRRHN